MRRLLIAITVLAGLASPLPTSAAYIVTIMEVGADVDASGSGTLNTTALSSGLPGDGFPGIQADIGAIIIGQSADFTAYEGLTGPSSFGTGGAEAANSATGALVIAAGEPGEIGIPIGYTSGAFLESSETWNSETISSLGLIAGDYTYTWGTGDTADFIAVNIEAPSIPTSEPASVALLLAALFGLALVRRRGGAILSPANT
jgi:hypothetical protein